MASRVNTSHTRVFNSHSDNCLQPPGSPDFPRQTYFVFQGGLKADEWLRAALDVCGGRGGGRAASAQGQAADAVDMGKGIEAAKAFYTAIP